MDVVVLSMLVLGFATHITAQVALVFALFARKPRWRGLAAFLVPPLAPIWGWRIGRKRTAALWGFALIVYAVGLAISQARA